MPTDFHVTAVTQTSVSLAWNASTDNVGVLAYADWASGTDVVRAAPPQTNPTVPGLHPGTTYVFRAEAELR